VSSKVHQWRCSGCGALVSFVVAALAAALLVACSEARGDGPYRGGPIEGYDTSGTCFDPDVSPDVCCGYHDVGGKLVPCDDDPDSAFEVGTPDSVVEVGTATYCPRPSEDGPLCFSKSVYATIAYSACSPDEPRGGPLPDPVWDGKATSPHDIHDYCVEVYPPYDTGPWFCCSK
jgi:hypothetical protein